MGLIPGDSDLIGLGEAQAFFVCLFYSFSFFKLSR